MAGQKWPWPGGKGPYKPGGDVWPGANNWPGNNIPGNKPWNSPWVSGRWPGNGWGWGGSGFGGLGGGGYGGLGLGGGGYGGLGFGGGGYWPGYWGGYRNRSWFSSPLLWGLGGWTLGSIYYNSGYGGSYYNPYYDQSYASAGCNCDYSQPVQVACNPNTDPYYTDPQYTADPTYSNDPAYDPSYFASVPSGTGVDPSTGLSIADPGTNTTPAVGNDPAPPAATDPGPATPDADPNAPIAALPAGGLAAVEEGTSHVDKARAAFKAGDYTTAQMELDLALAQIPNDSALHEFRALTLFATKEYSKSAAALYAVLAVGPGWNWTTMSSLYPSVGVYTGQLRDLEGFVRENPSDAASKFVLAYHYMTAGHAQSAVPLLNAVVQLQPKDKLSAQLLAMINPKPAAAEGATEAPPAESLPPEADPTQLPAITPEQVTGNWSATRDDGTHFSLKITADNKFTWSFERGNQKQSFSGTTSTDGPMLVLKRDDGVTMPGLIRTSANGFNFKLFGTSVDDPGIDFGR